MPKYKILLTRFNVAAMQAHSYSQDQSHGFMLVGNIYKGRIGVLSMPAQKASALWENAVRFDGPAESSRCAQHAR